MTKLLKLYNSFTRCINNVELGGKLLSAKPLASNDTLPNRGSLYICGPTVYSESHLGHALTYVRADLFRRFMRSLFNVRLITVMNITDIDDKILARASSEKVGRNDEESYVTNDEDHYEYDPARHPFHKISDKYYRSFTKDMNSLRVLPADLTIRVSRQINLVINFIKKLESNGHAYVADNGDIYFNVDSVSNYEKRIDTRREGVNASDSFKGNLSDFVLWKASKLNEPVWNYTSDISGRLLPGRPGWHVQCSAISSAIFGDKLDFHYGGRDLIFPHHYNEQACCCAYHGLDTSETIHVWTKNWLHSGHLILREEKMSKSIGNVISIDNFVNRSSVNALRLMCIKNHYRTNIDYSDDLLDDLKSLDHKLSAFISYLGNNLTRICDEGLALKKFDTTSCAPEMGSSDIKAAIEASHAEIIDGACDDLDLARGLSSILNLARLIYEKGTDALSPVELLSIWDLVKDWCDITGLDYGHIESSTRNDILVDLIQNYRQNVRNIAINGLKDPQSKNPSIGSMFKSVLNECDDIRSQLDELGFVVRDTKS